MRFAYASRCLLIHRFQNNEEKIEQRDEENLAHHIGCRPIILYYSFMYPFFLVTSRRHLLLLHYMMYIFSRWPLHQSETRVNESNITIRELPRISYNVQLTPIVFSDVDHTHFDRRSDCNNLASHWLIALMCLDFGPD